MATLTGLHIEGNLIAADLTPDLLTGEVKGQSPEDFGLEKSDKLADEIALAWGDAKAYWSAFQRSLARLPENDPATSVTREQWTVPLLMSLGYRPVYTAKAEVVEGQTYAISHRAERGENKPPIHVVGCRVRLEERPPSGTPRLSAHALVQEYLNRTEHLWAIATNGLRWRLLRDSSLMTRLTYVEFDLEQILEGENFAEFGLFYRLFHRSRLPEGMDDADECLLEFYHQESLQQGGRVRDRLRDGVEDALKILGTGFLQHPDNELLRQRLRKGSGESGVGSSKEGLSPTPDSPLPTPLTETDYYRQLLLLIYRLLFLMVAESRNLLIGSSELGVGSSEESLSSTPHSLLPTPNLAEKARIYREYYSIERLRALAERPSWRREGFQDLWQGLRVTFRLFDENWRGEVLGLSPLNGDLFGSHSLLDIDACAIDNHDLMLALRKLSLYEQRGQLRRVNYGALDVEELGSVYESLLDFHPQVVRRESGVGSRESGYPTTPYSPLPIPYSHWEFQLVTGSDRKTTGSYYTPPELVGQLIKSALEPVIEDRLKAAEREFRGSRESGVGSRGTSDGILSGSEGLAGSHDTGGDVLSHHQGISEGGNVRDDLSDSQGSGIGSGEHSRGVRSGESGRVHSVSSDSTGITEGTGNSFASGNQSEASEQSRNLARAAEMRNRGQNAQSTDSSVTEEVGSSGKSDPYSPLPTPHSLQAFQERALLKLKICDPACGSGHFLLAAARRIGKELARIRTGESQPAPEPLRQAIRDVIQHCIYGVDINPLAVDLCKVALWIEGLCRGTSLNFLDHRIKNGNSLVGVLDLDCLQGGIPDGAYKPVTGDDKSIASERKKANKKEREDIERNQLSLFETMYEQDRQEYAKSWRELEQMKDDDPAAVRQKQEKYERSRHSVAWLRDRSACNLWTAAFFMPLTEQNLQLLPTSAALENLLKGNWTTQAIVDAADRLAEGKLFFHWSLEYPEVFEQGGFDCVLGNPPWERIKLQEKEFFGARDPEIANAQNKAAREKLIRKLETTNPALAEEWETAQHDSSAQGKFIRESDRFPLTATGDINTYAVFAETVRKVIGREGRAGIIVPTGIATDDTCKNFFGAINQEQALSGLYDFENRERLFSEVDSRMKFALLGLSNQPIKAAKFSFFLTKPSQVDDRTRTFELSSSDIALLNPNNLTCPVFRTSADAELTKKIYRNMPVLENETKSQNPWSISFIAMFHMSNDSGLFESEPGGNHLPLYEAKIFHQFDHRWSSYEGTGTVDVSLEQKCDLDYTITPRYWVSKTKVEDRLAEKWKKQWLLGFRDITNATNERTVIFSLLPRVAVGHTAPILLMDSKNGHFINLLANFNSLIFAGLFHSNREPYMVVRFSIQSTR